MSVAILRCFGLMGCWPATRGHAGSLLTMLVLFPLLLAGSPGSARSGPPDPQLATTLHTDKTVRELQFSADGKSLAAVSGREVVLWEVSTWRVRVSTRPPAPDSMFVFALSPDGRHVAAPLSGRPRLWDLPKGKVMVLPIRTDVASNLTFSPDGKTLAVVGGDLSSVKLLDVAAGTELATLSSKDGVESLAFSPDGQTLATGEGGVEGEAPVPMVRLWDVAGRRERATLRVKDHGSIRSLAFSPDGKALATASHAGAIGGIVRVWDLAGERPRVLWKVKATTPERVVFSPDGRVLVVQNHLWKVKFWEAASGKELRTLQAHDWAIEAMALSPDGRLLAVACWEKEGTEHPEARTVKVWDISAITGRPVPDLPPAQEGERTGSAAQPADQAGELTGEELDRLWSDLAGEDAGRAFLAVWALADAPCQAVPFLAKQLKPAARPESGRLEQLLADLDSSDFGVRQKAAQELQGLGELTEPALRRELENPRSAEARQRVEQLLEKIAQGPPSAELLRSLRAVEALEHAGTPAARKVLETLAEGPPEARLTQEARFALERLARRPAAAP